MESLKRLQRQIIRAVCELEEELRERWPIGTDVEVFLKRGQVNATKMTVIGYTPKEYSIRVSMPNNKRFGRYIKDVPYWDVL